jgi:hypothetical protein
MNNILLASGLIISLAKWQEDQNLTNDLVAKYFGLNERSASGIFLFPAGFTVSAVLLIFMDRFREKLGKPVRCNSLFRSKAKQQAIRDSGMEAAAESPHCVGMAVDLDTNSDKESDEFVALAKLVAKELRIKIRIGFSLYKKSKMTFVHIDVCPEYYAKGKPLNSQKHPLQWEVEAVW